ncbi:MULTISPECIES: lysozyme [Flavobacterium]|uniref:Lysozyme n=1 Tax=Flavobacterium keumense TaxID=1306518 RepID=A0ABY8N397_9FLAO|nr:MULTISPECIES: lysozyme [Flavobacterium]WGK93801.1 lysozyme [Flavobacterium keumense]
MKFQIIKHYEGLHDGDLKQIGLQPKMCPAGVWTEGWGSAMIGLNGKFLKGAANKATAFKLAKVKTIEQADALFLVDIRSTLLIIRRKITVTLNESQTEALASFIYNTGGSSTLYRLINTKSPALFDWWCSHYVTGQGSKKPLRGLVARRRSEATQFTTGKVQFFN